VWDDVGRDILNFVVHVLPTAKQAAPAALPWQLRWEAEGAAPAVKIMGLGGSYGGLGHVMAAHSRPDVYHGVFLADTLIQPRALDRSEVGAENEQDVGTSRVRAAMKRRDAWSSRAEAGRTWLKNPFYAAWHPEVFDLTLSHGLVRANAYGTDTEGDPDVDDAPVVLATPTWAEASVFIEPKSSGRAWDMLPQLQVPVAFLVAQNRFPDVLKHEVVWRPPLARNEELVDTGHLCLQENPPAVAEAAVRFLQTLAAGKWGTKESIRAAYDAREERAKL
jgi:pimeloyl-ACP methyl ester carboxylesterase